MSLVSRCAKRLSATKLNFSIDHILNVAGGKATLESSGGPLAPQQQPNFDWLNCTRYKPPKLPRQKKKEGVQRRKLGRNPRIPFSSSQVALLEAKFLQTPYLSSSDVTQLASYLKLSETRVKIWFQNRRAREKRDKEAKGYGIKQFEETSKTSLSKEKEKAIKTISKINLDLQPNHALFRYINVNTDNYYQIVSPLDLSEKREADFYTKK